LLPDRTFYQRLLARDEAEAAELLESQLAESSLEELCDEVLIPTLVRARADREQLQLSEEDFEWILKTVHELFEEVAPMREPTLEEGAPEVEPARRPIVLACPTRDECELLALQLLARLLGPERAQVVLLAPGATASEVLQKVVELHPVAVCLGAIPPQSVPRSRYLCKRLRGRFPELPILAGCWPGPEGNKEEAHFATQLAAGASRVATTLSETCAEVVSCQLSVASQKSQTPVADSNSEPERLVGSGSRTAC
jgi:hypothetical protein